MNVLATLLKMMVLGLGCVMLVGGGLLRHHHGRRMGKTGAGGWELLIVAGVVGGIGWVLTRAMIKFLPPTARWKIRRGRGRSPASNRGDDSGPGPLSV